MSAAGKPRPSGTEIMLRSLGMGEILDAAKSLADNGTLSKILTFADHAESIVAQIRELNDNVTAMRTELSQRYVGSDTSPPDGELIGSCHEPILVSGRSDDTRSEQAGCDGAPNIEPDGRDARDITAA